ncbi:PAS domain-containing protein [Pseudalkalibacillus hwajinpoensis]|uniref:histidine kinase n=1 Tax=Guptibacillus hwajinpoensis TaxID=208199 RepID=A0A4U1MMA1_9BACL|nr:PAS domain S-box protein [Pseudalkalibacillus hwajinpoensis]TKD71841.1 PAS domain S-box protein [Pseudalkalibacillus hwajinpoensis]
MEYKKEEKGAFSLIEDGSKETSELRSELTEKNRKLQHIFNHSRDGMTLSNQKGTLIEVNQACCEIFELDKETIKTKIIGYHVAPEGREAFKQMRIDLQKKGYVVEKLPIILMNGKRKVVELSITYQAYRDLNLSIIRDVTSETDLFNKMMDNKEKLTSVFECALDGILLWKEDRSIVDANPAACELFNVSREEIKSYNLFDFLEGTNISIGKSFQKQLEERGEIRGDIQFTMAGGNKKDLEFTSKKSIYGNLYMTIYRDITETKNMIVELKESEERFRRLFEGALDGMAILSEEGRFVNINRACCRMFNIDYKSVIHSHYSEVEDNCEIIWNNSSEYGRSGEGKRVNPVTNQTQVFSFTLSYHIYPGHHLVIIRDVTEIKNAEENLRRTETSHVLGDLAAGVAHEIRNPLSTIKGFLQLLNGNDSVNQELLKVVGVEMEQVEEIVNEFLLLSKREFSSFESVDMNTLLKEVIERLSTRAVDAGITILELYDDVDVSCVCIRSHIKQVLSNIIENGIESMSRGGTLRVKLSEKVSEVKIEVEDEGNGIPAHLIDRLGEPYYQTSEKGTGLGLMVSYKVVKEHGGHIGVSSKEGLGTIFQITLPSHIDQNKNSIEMRRD